MSQLQGRSERRDEETEREVAQEWHESNGVTSRGPTLAQLEERQTVIGNLLI